MGLVIGGLQSGGGGGGPPSTPVTLSPIGSTPNANGATLTIQALNLEPADANFGGVVTNTAQTLAGPKQFTDTVTLINGLLVSPDGVNPGDSGISISITPGEGENGVGGIAGGNSGDVNFLGNYGGNADTTSTGGNGGNVVLGGGDGGNSGSVSGQAGAGGGAVFSGGDGGDAIGANAGPGGSVALSGGSGGFGVQGAGLPATGGSITIIGGQGGAADPTQQPGDGGSVTITSGDAGPQFGGLATGGAGTVSIDTGIPGPSGTATIVIGTGVANVMYLGRTGAICFLLGTASPERFAVTTKGDSTGTPGDATINLNAGRSAFAIGASVVVITNNRCAVTSDCFVTFLNLDATLTRMAAVCTANTITVTGNTVATAATSFSWLLVE